MTPGALLAGLRARGVTVEAEGDHLRIEGPDALLTDALLSELRQHKVALLAYLTAPADAVPLDELLTLPLDRFAALGRAMLEVRVPGLPDPPWFVPTEGDVAGLVAAGISRGRIWTAGELSDLLSVPGMTRERAMTVARAKLAFAGELVRSAPSPRERMTKSEAP